MIILKVAISVICLFGGLGLADWLKENAPHGLPLGLNLFLAIVSLSLTIGWIGLWF